MFNRFVLIAIIVPVAIVLIMLAVANRAPVAFTLDPINPGNPGLTVQLPFFVFLFLALGCGMVIGSLATWLKQGRYRKEARVKRREVQNLLQQVPPAPAADKPTGLPAVRA